MWIKDVLSRTYEKSMFVISDLLWPFLHFLQQMTIIIEANKRPPAIEQAIIIISILLSSSLTGVGYLTLMFLRNSVVFDEVILIPIGESY